MRCITSSLALLGALSLLAFVDGVASAQPRQDFARYLHVAPARVQNVYGLDFTHRGTMVDRVLLGARRDASGPLATVVFVARDAKGKVWTRSLMLGRAARVRALKVVDLMGRPTPLEGFIGEHPSAHVRRLALGGMRRPALALRTYFSEPGRPSSSRPPGGARLGARVSAWLYLVSLRRADFGQLLFRKELRSRGSYGHGVAARFRLVAGRRRMLRVEESRVSLLGNGSGCPAPKPHLHYHVWNKTRYREVPSRVPRRTCY